MEFQTMNEQTVQQPHDRFKKSKVYTRDMYGRFTRRLFEFDCLPMEVQTMILLKAAVTHRLSGKTFDHVYRNIESVSGRWKDIVREPWFDEKVKQEVFRKGTLNI